MQYINKHVEGRQEVGHIDLMGKYSYIEVPEKDAKKVMTALDGTKYKGREVRCNDADEKGHGNGASGSSRSERKKDRGERTTTAKKAFTPQKKSKSSGAGYGGALPMSDYGDWRQFFKNGNAPFKGEEPDFSEEGWAMRKPRKKK